MKKRNSSTTASGASRGAEAFILLAITLVSVAVACRAYFQLGAGVGVSMGLMAATYIVLVGLHALRGRLVRSRGASEKAGATSGGTAPAVAAGREPPVTAGPPVRSDARSSAQGQPPPQTQPAGMAMPRGAPSPAGRAAPAPSAQSPGEAPRPAAPVARAPLASEPPSNRPGQEPSEDEFGLAALKDFWTYRPSDPLLEAPASRPPPPRPDQPRAAGASGPQAGSPPANGGGEAQLASLSPRGIPPRAAAPAQAPPAALGDADVEMIQSLIKKLADEVNAAEAPAAPASQRPAAAEQPAHPSGSLDSSIEALRMTAGTMRESAARASHLAGHEEHAGDRAPRVPPRSPIPDVAFVPERVEAPSPADRPSHGAPPPVREGHLQIAAIAEAVHARRFDVLLEPIMGLGDLRACHYEVSLRLLDPAGGVVPADPADRRLAGTSLLPLLDLTLLERSATVARRLSERGKKGSVFSGLSGEALTDPGFMAAAAGSSRDHVRRTGQLVLTFAQNDLRMASEAQLKSLLELRAMGFRFALSEVTDLDMDFEHLVAIGVELVKLDADVFLEGLRAPHGVIPARDICAHLEGLGLSLIVDRIDTEQERSRLMAFGVSLGQGTLFGGARPMKADALSGARHAAA